VSLTDSELIVRVVTKDDRNAFGELVQRHQGAVRRFLRYLTRGDQALADDLAQETFIQAYRGLGNFKNHSSIATWLLGIARNHWRNRRRREKTAHATLEPISAEETAPSPARATDLKNDLSEAIRHLDEEEQVALHLCYHQGLSHSEISDVLGWPVGTVKTHLARSKEKLRPLLAAWNPLT
jgi:RNA polymerase sigma-70 factor (ECF subfamily)